MSQRPSERTIVTDYADTRKLTTLGKERAFTTRPETLNVKMDGSFSADLLGFGARIGKQALPIT